MFGRLKRDQTPARQGSIMGMSQSGFHRVAYADWGTVDDECPVLCVHGLTRQGRDFDHLAQALAKQSRRTVCPDLVGRGRSGQLNNPDEYALPQYCADMNAVIARIGAEEVDWVGTSLGGLIGIVMAGMPGSRIRRLVVNDIGPYISSTGLSRIGSYLADMPRSFHTVEEAEQYFRDILAPYGDLTDAQWRHLTVHSIAWEQLEQRYLMLCDRSISRVFRGHWFYSLNLWKYWEAISAPILVLHGRTSDLLTDALTSEMAARNKNAEIIHIENCGHVPPLMEPSQIRIVTDFLAK